MRSIKKMVRSRDKLVPRSTRQPFLSHFAGLLTNIGPQQIRKRIFDCTHKSLFSLFFLIAFYDAYGVIFCNKTRVIFVCIFLFLYKSLIRYVRHLQASPGTWTISEGSTNYSCLPWPNWIKETRRVFTTRARWRSRNSPFWKLGPR